MHAPVLVTGTRAHDYAHSARNALGALRLNKQFPPWQRLADHIDALATSGEIRIDPATALPTPREWVRVRVERDLAPATLAEFADIDITALPAAEARAVAARRDRLAHLATLAPLAAREVRVALRKVEGARAHYRVIVDRFDLSSGTFARYTALITDDPGRRVSHGELELHAERAFQARLELLGTQDAALAFAVLRAEGLEVEEVVRGVVGPGVLDDTCGPPEVRGVVRGLAVSACLERVSIDLEAGRIDDPIAHTLTVPAADVDFGLSWHRKWAAADADLPALRAWLRSRDSRNLVYAY